MGRFERVKEVRFESIVFEDKFKNVIRVMLKVYFYEEVVYDIYWFENEILYESLGVVGEREVLVREFILELK